MKVRYCAWMVALALLGGPGAIALEVGQESATTVAPKPQREPEERRQGQRGPRKWWVDPSDRAELDITADQSAKLEAIFQSTLRGQRERWSEFRKLEPAVEQLIKDGTADPDYVTRQVERAEMLKAEMTATRIVTLYRMLRELSPEQVQKFRRMEERREAERRKSTDSPSRRF
jgi:Spy/CpxP family protein refolding chaperone